MNYAVALLLKKVDSSLSQVTERLDLRIVVAENSNEAFGIAYNASIVENVGFVLSSSVVLPVDPPAEGSDTTMPPKDQPAH